VPVAHHQDRLSRSPGSCQLLTQPAQKVQGGFPLLARCMRHRSRLLSKGGRPAQRDCATIPLLCRGQPRPVEPALRRMNAQHERRGAQVAQPARPFHLPTAARRLGRIPRHHIHLILSHMRQGQTAHHSARRFVHEPSQTEQPIPCAPVLLISPQAHHQLRHRVPREGQQFSQHELHHPFIDTLLAE